MPLQNLNNNYGKINKNMQKVCQTQLKVSQYMKMTETNNGKVTGIIRGSYLTYADEHTEVFMNSIEKTRSIYTKI